MKILHCCLANFFIDNYGYQENILPKIHKLQGHDVCIVASTETYIGNNKIGYLAPDSYFTADGIPITRLPYLNILPHVLARKLRVYTGLSKFLRAFQPEIIFLHDVQFVSIWEIAKYAKKNKVKVIADSHTDLINSAKTWVSLNILHRIIYRSCAKIIEPYTMKFFGTLPIRVDFLKDIYGIPENKLDLLVLGADDTLYCDSDLETIRHRVRHELGIEEKDFVIISGGKIDKRKNIHILLKAFQKIQGEKIKLILFGSITDDIKFEIEPLISASRVIFLGWLNPRKVYDILFSADLGFFPGTHSVLWEQCVGIGLPCVFKRWPRIQHVDLGGNCRFIDDVGTDIIHNEIELICNNENLYNGMKKAAMVNGIAKFSYSEIAKQAIAI
ncbi:MAG: hypothetical protein GQF41_0485 [Candidatus Rifleibacterium amylolyticum]|nr:MAG: hypothetical protein GQF41_0485 [Candidatus Rifleibacterium amylolyticum]